MNISLTPLWFWEYGGIYRPKRQSGDAVVVGRALSGDVVQWLTNASVADRLVSLRNPHGPSGASNRGVEEEILEVESSPLSKLPVALLPPLLQPGQSLTI